ncbi:hypothetical protein VMCG_06049 [Cytospora schulzeri]|uniref:Myb-like domain-containing protein n=1 Tax=Cytospora schulzeri TaxID=448051 RepID=A0A423WGK5_9PEZI|nr:hypothetical protein VMCG_06049 [Valsa malicola]
MCLYITFTCPGNCGNPLSTEELIAACKSSTVQPLPDNFWETHPVDHMVVPLCEDEVQRRFPQGYSCSEPTCSQRPAAISTTDLSHLVRCPGCGFTHSRVGDTWVETWIGQNGVTVPFLHKSQWARFACSQRNLCHFNPAYESELRGRVHAIESEMNGDINAAYVPPWTEADEDTLRRMKAEGAPVNTIATALGRTRYSIISRWRILSKADGTYKPSINHWTDVEVEELRRMKGEGVPSVVIGRLLGRTSNAIDRKWNMLNKAANA